MKHATTGILLAVATLLPPVATADDAKVELMRNPFERPALATLAPAGVAARTERRDSGAPGLRAVLVAGDKSAVNFGGEIIQVGESAKGYRLLAVEEGRAVFINKGKRVTISLYEPSGSEEQ